MKKKQIVIIPVLLATFVMLLSSVIPHHHHGDTVCFTSINCDHSVSDFCDHHHSSDKCEDYCGVKQLFEINQLKEEINFEDSTSDLLFSLFIISDILQNLFSDTCSSEITYKPFLENPYSWEYYVQRAGRAPPFIIA